MRVPPELRQPAAKAVGVVAFSILFSIFLALVGALGLWSFADERWRGPATVVTAARCSDADAKAEITYQRDGAERRATLDGCGHLEGETVEVAVDGDRVIVAQATAGATTDARPIGVVLCVFAGIAGAGFAQLWRRSGHVL